MGGEIMNYPDEIPLEYGLPLAAALWVIVLLLSWSDRRTK